VLLAVAAIGDALVQLRRAVDVARALAAAQAAWAATTS
jgi:hypothetical protein